MNEPEDLCLVMGCRKPLGHDGPHVGDRVDRQEGYDEE